MVHRVRLGGATAGYWIFYGSFFKTIGSLTMVDKNIVIAVSMKQNGVCECLHCPLDSLVVLVYQVRPRKKDCP